MIYEYNPYQEQFIDIIDSNFCKYYMIPENRNCSPLFEYAILSETTTAKRRLEIKT